MQILSKKAKNNNFWTIFSVFDKFQPSPLIFWGLTSVTLFVVDDLQFEELRMDKYFYW